MKKFLIAAVIIFCATGLAQATIIIDDFTKNGTPNNDLTIGPGTNPTGDLTATRTGPTANIMGGTCNITFNRSTGNSSVSYYVTGAPPYYAEYSSAYTANEVGYWRMEYGKSANLNADLSYGASAIQVDIVNSDMCFSGTDTRSIPTTLTVTSGKETTPVTASKTINIKCDGTYNFNFGDFTGVNFADVDYIKIQFDFINATQNNVDVAVTKIYTVGTTLIQLAYFQAIPGNGQVTLKWSTESETDNAGFNLYRATAEDGEYKIINSALIAAEGSSTQGASYEYTDTGLRNGKTYYYKLEDIDLNGRSTMHEAASATPMGEDTTPPEISIITPQANVAVQDGVTFQAKAFDFSGIYTVSFSLREPDGGEGIPIGYDDLEASYNSASGYWEYPFNTTVLQDGYYVIFAKAIDNEGNEGMSSVVSFSIRNWAVITMLPSTANNKAGRTMPIKFSLRIAASVDPAMPFVYNEDLVIVIYDKTRPRPILWQQSLFGKGSKDYRINAETYITNFQTKKNFNMIYFVDIVRYPQNPILLGTFTFATTK